MKTTTSQGNTGINPMFPSLNCQRAMAIGPDIVS
jgi:hypothetical protein